MLHRKEVQRLYSFLTNLFLTHQKMTIDYIIAWKLNITLFLPLFKIIFLHSRYTDITSIRDTPSNYIQVDWFHLHKNMNVKLTPPNPEIQIRFLLVYFCYSIFHQLIFYIFFEKKKLKKKIQSNENEKCYVIGFLKFKNIKVFKSLAMGYVYFLQHLFMRVTRKEGSSKRNTSQNLFFITLTYIIEFWKKTLFVLRVQGLIER